MPGALAASSLAMQPGKTCRIWDGIRHALWKNPGPDAEEALMPFLQLEGIKMVYLHGHKNPELSPDNWNMDFRFMERPNARRVHLDLFYDYRKNVELYPAFPQLLFDLDPCGPDLLYRQRPLQ